MKSILRSTALLSGSSIVSLLIGLVSAKAWAILLGPDGLGYMGLLQSLVGLAGLVVGAGLTTGIVRTGANALAKGDHARFAALHRATWWLFWVLGGFTVIFMIVFRIPISNVMLGGSEHAWSVVLMSIAFLFGLASNLKISTLNAYHRVKTLAQLGMLNSLLSAIFGLIAVLLWHEQGVELAVLLGSIVPWALASWRLRVDVPPLRERPSRNATRAAARGLLMFGLPYTASMLVGTGVQYLVPTLVLHSLNAESVGFYRAAIAISVTYLGFLLSAMAMDYYPRASAVSDQPRALVQLVNQQHRLVLLLAGPLILGMLALAPYLIPLVYTPAFAPAVPVLEWTLIGDLLKFASWTMGFIIVARSKSLVVFLVELVVGLNTLLWSWLGMRWFGIAGVGIAYLITYAAHYLIVWAIVRRDIKLAWTTENKRLLLMTLLAALAIQLLPLIGLEQLRTPVALAFAIIAGLYSLYLIWHDVGGYKDVSAWLRRNMPYDRAELPPV